MNRQNLTSLWDEEYQNKGVPTSYRTTPSESLILFLEFLKGRNAPLGKTILDMGCGKGRNAIYLAKEFGREVYGIDISSVAIEGAKEAALRAHVRHLTHFSIGDLTKPWQYKSSFFDTLIDVTAFFHLTEKSELETYKKELARVAKKGAYILQYIMARGDGYYGQFVVDSKDAAVFTDPINNIPARLYDENELRDFFNGLFSIELIQKLERTNIIHQKEYKRRMFIVILRKM